MKGMKAVGGGVRVHAPGRGDEHVERFRGVLSISDVSVACLLYFVFVECSDMFDAIVSVTYQSQILIVLLYMYV